MIEIYKYNPSSTWFKNVVNDSTLKGKNRDTAIENAIKEHGVQISIAEYFKDWNRNSCCKDYCYACYNGAENSIERLVNAEINYDKDLTYLNAKNNNPEDLIESRTSWDEMKGYADGLYWFINSIINDVVMDKIIIPQTAWWKPSEEQMNTFEQWLKDNQYKGDARYCYPIFESLYQELKKLKE